VLKSVRVLKPTMMQVLVCDACEKPIGKYQIRVSIMHKEKGINDRDQWSTKKTMHFHRKCFSTYSWVSNTHSQG